MDMDVNENRQKRARAVGDEIGLRLGILMYFRYKRKQIKKTKKNSENTQNIRYKQQLQYFYNYKTKLCLNYV